GPPAWAGGGGKDKSKPAAAEQGQAKKAANAARKAERRAARTAAQAPDADAPKHENPAWICKFEREQMGAEAFAEAYGAAANAFGKCVSREAHDRDGVTGAGEEPVEPAEAPVDESGAAASQTAEALAIVNSALESSRSLLL
ncbi:MAG: hypothetical protein ACREJR_09695, partial [Candidatus Rokuibacteriota bacterium]